jgi:N-acetyltransferase 10
VSHFKDTTPESSCCKNLKFHTRNVTEIFQAIILGLGLQYKTVDNLASELELPASQLLGLFNRTIRQCVQYLTGILEHSIEQGLVQPRTDIVFNPVAKSMHDELEEAAKVINSVFPLH